MTVVDAEAVSSSIDLGWRLAELYDSPELPGPSPASAESKPLPSHLPGAGEMSPYEKASALIDHIEADLRSLGSVTGGELADVADARQALDRPEHSADEVRKEVLKLYLKVRNTLAGSAPMAATALGLGRMLADTSLRPTSKDAQLIVDQFDPFRLSNAYAWLYDLENILPKQAASSVRGSLAGWQEWVSKLPKENGHIDPARIDEQVVRALRRQGHMWRRLLVGEKDPVTLLQPDDYVAAAERLVVSIRKIAGHFLLRWIVPVVLFAAVVAASVWAAVTFAPAGTARVAAVLVSLAGALGLSWKGVEGTLGKAVTQAESALWNAEVADGIAAAATILPPTRN